MIENQIVIKEPQKPLINRIIAAFLYSIFITYIFYLVNAGVLFSHPNIVKIVLLLMTLLCVLVLFTFPTIASHFIRFDYKELKIRHEYQAGFFVYKESWQDLIDLNYISIIKNQDEYLAVLWYQEHNFLNLFSLNSYNEIVEKTCLLSYKLNIELLDSTNDDDINDWIDISEYQKTKEIKYLD